MNEESEYFRRLKELAQKKTSDARAAAEAEMAAQLERFPRMAHLAANDRFAKTLERFITALHEGGRDLLLTHENPKALRADLVEMFQFRSNIHCDRWLPDGNPDESLADEENLVKCFCDAVKATCHDVFHERRERVDDLLVMFGKLARNIKSVFLPRIIAMISEFSNYWGYYNLCTGEQAEHLVDEFATCWGLLLTEVRLLNDDELLKAWPEIPQHESHDVVLFDSDSMCAEDASDESRRQALEIYCRMLRDKGMMPKYADGDHPMQGLLDDIVQLLRDVNDRKPSTDERWNSFDYELLTRVLETDTIFSYDCYEDEECEDGGYSERQELMCNEPTRENALKREIIAQFGKYLDAASALALELGSKAYDDFARCQTTWAAYNGNFHVGGWDEKQALAANRDLQVFIDALKRARPILWADCVNYKPPAEPKPMKALVDGFTADGKREAVSIVHTKAREKDYLSDANLRMLFDVGENTPYNWRTGKVKPPEGFLEAFEKKDYKAMQKCAERYRADRGKSDAMNQKHLVRNLSDEEMAKRGAKMPDGRCDDPQ